MKKYWDTEEKKRAAILSGAFHLILILLFIFFGLKYLDPAPENGIVINFGNSETGFGEKADGAEKSTPSQPKTQPQTQKVEQTTEETTDPLQTQDVTDAPSVNTQSSQKVETQESQDQQEPEETQPDTRKLDDLFKTTANSQEGGQGENKGPGDQGKPEGSLDSDNYTGPSGGGDGNGNYFLKGRDALNKPKPDYECSAEGRVVVRISVDAKGKVIKATPGAKVPNGLASTTTDNCLYKKARTAALKTTWQADSDAEPIQVGYIIYNFYKS